MASTIPQFLQYIGCSNFTNEINSAFDQTMALYSLIGATEISNINMTTEDTAVEYKIELPSEIEAYKMNNTYNNKFIFSCGRRFNVTTTVCGSNINIRMK